MTQGFKSHNFGLCRKCGKKHIFQRWNPERKKEKIEPHECKYCGIITKNYRFCSLRCKGRFYMKSGEENIAKRPDVRKKLSEIKKGKKNPYMSALNKDPVLKEKRRLGKLGMKYNMTPEGRKKNREVGGMNLKRYIEKNGNPMSLQLNRDKVGKKTKEHWEDPANQIRRIMLARGYESIEHNHLKQVMKEKLISNGYDVVFERPVTVNGHFYVVDVYGEKGDEKMVIECGNCPRKKIDDLKTKYVVEHVTFKEARKCGLL